MPNQSNLFPTILGLSKKQIEEIENSLEIFYFAGATNNGDNSLEKSFSVFDNDIALQNNITEMYGVDYATIRAFIMGGHVSKSALDKLDLTIEANS
jgi:hypothetical protein